LKGLDLSQSSAAVTSLSILQQSNTTNSNMRSFITAFVACAALSSAMAEDVNLTTRR